MKRVVLVLACVAIIALSVRAAEEAEPDADVYLQKYSPAKSPKFKGPQGVTGAPGPQGTTGAVGAQGTTGAVGAQGTTGAVGAQGTTGAVGAQGTTGARGATGAQGTTGTMGAQGTTGTVGAQGTTGTNAPGPSQFCKPNANGVVVYQSFPPNADNSNQVILNNQSPPCTDGSGCQNNGFAAQGLSLARCPTGPGSASFQVGGSCQLYCQDSADYSKVFMAQNTWSTGPVSSDFTNGASTTCGAVRLTGDGFETSTFTNSCYLRAFAICCEPNDPSVVFSS